MFDSRPLIDHAHPGHALGAETGNDLLGIFILENILAEFFRLPLDVDPLDAAAALEDLLEDAVGGILEDVGGFDEPQAEARIRPVGTHGIHGFLVGHPGKGPGKGDAADGKHPDNQLFHQFIDEFLIDERRLQVELGEFGLAVGTQILVAEAADDLEISLIVRSP